MASWRFLSGLWALALLGGCGGVKVPAILLAPEARVLAVRVVETGPEATRLSMRVAMVNPGKTALPLVDARYQLTVDGRTYATRTEPNVTVPAGGRVEFELPAVVKGQVPSGSNWSAWGRLEMKPLRDFGQLLLGLLLMRPSTPMDGAGRLSGGGSG
ncbi:MAG: hypothetical protein R3236_10125 [Phycisphaeraceae bacterium]|nr:hypothetical protein [Phycisphaeraceae bacterium]